MLGLELTMVSDREAVVDVAGRVDRLSSPRFARFLVDLMTDGVAHITIDLAKVPTIDVLAAELLADVGVRVRASGGRLMVTSPTRAVHQMLCETGADQSLDILA